MNSCIVAVNVVQYSVVNAIANIQPEFQEAVACADRLSAGYFGDRLQAAYLSGSIPVGDAWPGASDFDCFLFTSDVPTAGDLQWRAQSESELAKQFPVVSVFHLNLFPRERLENESFWRFILKYNAVRFRGGDILMGLAERGYPTPEPTPAFARGRRAFVAQCVEAACRGECPPSLGEKLADPMLWTRKLVRNFILVEGAFLLMVAGRFRSFRQADVLSGLEKTFPQWSDLYDRSRAILKDPYAQGVYPEQFIRDAGPFLQWTLQVLQGHSPRRDDDAAVG